MFNDLRKKFGKREYLLEEAVIDDGVLLVDDKLKRRTGIVANYYRIYEELAQYLQAEEYWVELTKTILSLDNLKLIQRKNVFSNSENETYYSLEFNEEIVKKGIENEVKGVRDFVSLARKESFQWILDKKDLQLATIDSYSCDNAGTLHNMGDVYGITHTIYDEREIWNMIKKENSPPLRRA